MSLPGTYREADGVGVTFADALDTWAAIAYDFLIEVAHTYNRWTTYGELTDRVQAVSGIRTRMQIGHWVGKVLARVAERALHDDLPPLAALCVRQDGTMGDGYGRSPDSVAVMRNVDDLAAEHRLECYRRFAADLPADGGRPTLTAAVLERRARAEVRQP